MSGQRTAMASEHDSGAGTKPAGDGSGPYISIVIPTLGRPILIKTVESLLDMKGSERAEIIVIGKLADQQVRDRMVALQKAQPGIRHIAVSFDTGDLSKKKNLGVKVSRADLIAFVDDDLLVAPDWMAAIIAPFSDESVGMVCGPSLLPPDLPLLARLSGLILASKASGFVSKRYTRPDGGPQEATWSAMIGCNMVCRRSSIIHAGGFNEGVIPGEDLLAAYRMRRSGERLMFVPAAYVLHYPRQTFTAFCRQAYRFGAARIRLMRVGVRVEPTSLIPALWVAALVGLGVLAPVARVALWLLLLQGVLYLGFCAWATLLAFLKTRRALDALMLLLIPFMHVCYGVGEWVEVFRPGRNLPEKQASSPESSSSLSAAGGGPRPRPRARGPVEDEDEDEDGR